MKFFCYFCAETETSWAQGPVTWDYKKLYSIRPRCSTFKHFHICCSVCDEIRSAYAQCAIKFIPRMLSMDVDVKNLFTIYRWLSMCENSFLLCSGCDEIVSLYGSVCNKIVSTYAQHTHAIIFENYSKIQI